MDRYPGRRRTRRAIALAAALLLPLAGLSLAAGASAQARRTVAVLPLKVHAMEDQTYLRSGLSDMLASRLGRFEEVGVIGASDAALATTDPEAARAAGRELGADWVLFGSFTRFGDGASLDVRCLEVEAPAEEGARSIFVQAGRLGEIIPKLDGLAEKVARFVASEGTARPDVAAAGPAAPGGDSVEDLREDVRALRDRVEKLEAIIPGGSSGEPVTERDLGGEGSARGADLAGELR